jgi:hypothetical protein
MFDEAKIGEFGNQKCILACSWDIVGDLQADHWTLCGGKRVYVRSGGNRTNCKYKSESPNTRLTIDIAQALSSIW